jgi:CheY-like chemotaxis protein
MSKRILVVEDQEDNRQIVRDLLTANNYEMTEAENGEEALAAVAKDRPDTPRRIAAVRRFGRDRSEANMPRTRRACRSDAFDPTRTSLPKLAVMHNATHPMM